MLYKVLDFITKSSYDGKRIVNKGNAFKFCFFMDVWLHNKDITLVQSNKQYIYPMS